jgi:hypothetical protein
LQQARTVFPVLKAAMRSSILRTFRLIARRIFEDPAVHRRTPERLHLDPPKLIFQPDFPTHG